MTAATYIFADDVASRLAAIELHNFSVRLGLLSESQLLIEHQLVVAAASCIDELSWINEEKASRLAVLIISILWEYSENSLRETLRERFVLCLSRLGLAPTAGMVDADYPEYSSYAPFNSYRAELATMAMQLQYSQVLGSLEFSLTRFQKNVLLAIDANRLVGISAPTSAGKSFAIYLAIAKLINKDRSKKVVYIVPTVSLINQVSSDLRKLFLRLGMRGIEVKESHGSGAEGAVYVLTQERALVGIESDVWGGSLGMLVVDEVQNLERVAHDDELRSKVLFDVITELSSTLKIEKIVLSGPRLENVGDLGVTVFGGSAEEVVALDSPVVSLTYSIVRQGEKAFITQHREYLSEPLLQKEISHPEVVQGQGQSQYTDSFLGFLDHLIVSLGAESQNIIFSPTADQSVRTSASFSGVPAIIRRPELGGLSEYLADSVHPHYSLTALVRRGVAYHNGKMPPHARFAVEEAFRAGYIQSIACTTTLMQGVNLPANVVFVRNPKLFVKASSARVNSELSSYEFANLRGRAGRLMKDLVGRTVVLDEESFSTIAGTQTDLFDETHKTLKSGYGDLFSANKENVLAELRRPGTVDNSAAKFIATHVRQTFIRHGASSGDRLSRVGINLTDRELSVAFSVVSELDINRDVCLKNRYWDPFDLQLMRDSFESSGLADLPGSVWTRDLATHLIAWINFHAAVVPFYFERYFRSKPTDRMIYAIAKSAETWARETPLKKIIDGRHFPAGEVSQIDHQVSIIYKNLVFGLPSLLKPLSDIRGVGGSVLAAIESGTYHPVSMFLTEKGVFRETAVSIRQKLLPDISANEVAVEDVIVKRISSSLDQLGPWVSRQVAPLLIN